MAETIPIHDMPNISPFSSLYSAGLTIKINNGIIPSTNGNRHITINLLRFRGYDANATNDILPVILPIVTSAFLG